MTTPGSAGQGAEARATLDSLTTDAERLAARAVAPALWYYPALALAAGAMVAAPAIEDDTISITVLSLTAVVFALIAVAHRKQTGVAVRYTSTPRSLALAILVSVVIAGLLVVSFVLAQRGAHDQIVWTAVGAFLGMLLGSYVADRVHRAELRRAY